MTLRTKCYYCFVRNDHIVFVCKHTDKRARARTATTLRATIYLPTRALVWRVKQIRCLLHLLNLTPICLLDELVGRKIEKPLNRRSPFSK